MRLNMTARQQRQALSIVAMSVRLALAPADGLNPVQHEAMDDASTPPPGLYYLGYFLNYRSNNLRTPVSNERVPGDVRVENTSFVNRLMWITDSKLLGADYGMEVIVPMVHSSMHSSTYGLDRHESGGSDIYVSPLILGWHMPRWDVSAGAGVWLDSGRAGALGPGLGYRATCSAAALRITWMRPKSGRHQPCCTTSAMAKPTMAGVLAIRPAWNGG